MSDKTLDSVDQIKWYLDQVRHPEATSETFEKCAQAINELITQTSKAKCLEARIAELEKIQDYIDELKLADEPITFYYQVRMANLTERLKTTPTNPVEESKA